MKKSKSTIKPVSEKNFLYKDADGIWWSLDVERAGPISENSLFEDDPDYYWYYRLSNDKKHTVVTGKIWGQYDICPGIESFMIDIQKRFLYLCIGWASINKN